jgi:type 1 fimbria pilin
MKTKITAIAAAFVASVAFASNAAAGDDDGEIRLAGTCTDSSSSKIKVKHDDGKIEVEFEVDQNQTGDVWKVKIKDNGSNVFKGTATTRGPSGSFEIERKIADQSGSDAIKATAKNKSTDERCSASATL